MTEWLWVILACAIFPVSALIGVACMKRRVTESRRYPRLPVQVNAELVWEDHKHHEMSAPAVTLDVSHSGAQFRCSRGIGPETILQVRQGEGKLPRTACVVRCRRRPFYSLVGVKF